MNPLNPFPDEVAWGYADRLKTLLGPAILLRHQERCRPARTVDSQAVSLLAHIASLPVERFVQSHTTVPFAYCVADGDDVENFETTTTNLDRASLTPYGQSMHLCPNCCREDLDWFQFSYWRRSHQVAGIFECRKHSVALLCCPRTGYSGLQPHEVLGFSQPMVSPTELENIRANSFSARYAETALSLLDQSAPLPFDLFVRMLLSHRDWIWPEFWAATWVPIEQIPTGWILSDGHIKSVKTRHLNIFWHVHDWVSKKLKAEAPSSWLRPLLCRPNGRRVSIEELVSSALKGSLKVPHIGAGFARAAVACIVCSEVTDAQNLFNRQAIELRMAAAQARLGISAPQKVPLAGINRKGSTTRRASTAAA